MIDVYCIRADAQNVSESSIVSEVPSLIDDLPSVKRDRILSIRPAAGRVNSALGWRLLRFALHDHGHTDFALSQLSFDGNGKPRWPHHAGDFNLSHTHALIACAVTDTGRVGIDCEHIRAIPTVQLLRRIASPREDVPANADALTFFRLWTQKEAVIKAEGNGGVWDMTRVCLDGDDAYYRDTRWYVYPLKLAGDDYVAHVASDIPGRRVDVHEVTIERLLRRGGPDDQTPQMV